MNHAVLKDIQAKARNFPHLINSGRSHQSKSGGSIAKADWNTAIAEGLTSVIGMAVQITKADASITETKQKPHHHYKSKRMYHSRRSTAYVIFSIYHYFSHILLDEICYYSQLPLFHHSRLFLVCLAHVVAINLGSS